MSDEHNSDDEDKSCSMCLESFDDSGWTLRCGHTFHFQCIEKWCETSPACPLCRAEVNIELERKRGSCCGPSPMTSPITSPVTATCNTIGAGIPTEHSRCGAMTKKRRPCKNRRNVNGFCYLHQPKTPLPQQRQQPPPPPVYVNQSFFESMSDEEISQQLALWSNVTHPRPPQTQTQTLEEKSPASPSISPQPKSTNKPAKKTKRKSSCGIM
jgi:hypothetical protein